MRFRPRPKRTLKVLQAFAPKYLRSSVTPGVGRIVERPFIEAGRLVLVLTVKLSLSVAHRVLDGATVARFLDDLVALVEAPIVALVL